MGDRTEEHNEQMDWNPHSHQGSVLFQSGHTSSSHFDCGSCLASSRVFRAQKSQSLCSDWSARRLYCDCWVVKLMCWKCQIPFIIITWFPVSSEYLSSGDVAVGTAKMELVVKERMFLSCGGKTQPLLDAATPLTKLSGVSSLNHSSTPRHISRTACIMHCDVPKSQR